MHVTLIVDRSPAVYKAVPWGGLTWEVPLYMYVSTYICKVEETTIHVFAGI